MKKLITTILLFALAVPVFAQDYMVPREQKWTVRTSAAYIPAMPTFVSIFGAIFVGVAVGLNEENNEDLDIIIPPYFSVDALYSFNNRWSAGVSTGYNGCVWNVVDKDTRQVHSSSFINFIPVNAVGRYNYLNREKVKLYGSLEAGVILMVGNGVDLAPNFQVNPIGVEYGKNFFGMAELGIGMNYVGGRAGIGYRF